jgi:hypothetical protein
VRTLFIASLLAASLLPAQTLGIYAIDGGRWQVDESMLIDTGYAGNYYRDANRITAAGAAAGVTFTVRKDLSLIAR